MSNMAILVVEFSREEYKIQKVFGLKNSCSQMKLPNLEKRAVKKCQNLTFKVNPLNLPGFLKEEYKFRSTFVVIEIF